MIKVYKHFLILLFAAGTLSLSAQCTFTGLNANYCTNSAVSSLTPAAPGGNFVGPGVVGSNFDPSIAGPGTHTISYGFCSSSYVISSGAFAPTSTVGTPISLTDDATSAQLPIGFSFQFYCNTFTSFYICSNGFITFNGGQASPYTPTAVPSASDPLNMIAFAWTDLNPSLGGNITYTTVGSAPNRKLIVSFTAIQHYNGANGGFPITSQIMLYESTNEIEIHTTTMPIPASGDNCLMGIQNGSATPTGTAVTGRNNTNTWSATNEMYKFTPGVTCSSSQTAVVSPSSITVNGNAPICAGTTATLTAGGNNTYTWSSSTNTSISTTSVANVSPLSTTSYTVSGTNSFGCVASSAITVTVSPGTPTLSITSSTPSTCYGKTATLTASGALTYTWSHNLTNGVSFNPSVTTTYTVSGQNGCGITTATTAITIVPLPLSIALTPTAYCTNSTATITATTPGNTYTWEPGNIVNTNPVSIVNPSVNTIYTITASDGTCSGTSTVSLIANPVPTIVSSANSTIVCPGGTVNLSASGGNNYTWTPGNLNGSSVVVSPTVTTLYTVVGDNNFGCNNSSTQVLVVGVQPTLVVSPPGSTICAGGSVTLNVSGADTYVWSNGPTTALNSVSPSQTTIYSVIGTNSISLCSETASVTVDVVDPVITIAGNSTICSGATASLTPSGATSYTWNPGFITFPVLTVGPSVNTIYTLSALSSTNNVNCLSTRTIEIVVNPSPTITATGAQSVVCAKHSNTFTAAGASTYTWFAPGTASNVVSPSISVNSSSAAVFVYTVSGTDAKGCESKTEVAMNFNACLGIDETVGGNDRLVIFPNPNNGQFVLRSNKVLDLSLTNELGQEIRKIKLSEENGFSASLNDIAAGLYFLSGKTGSYKIIVNQ